MITGKTAIRILTLASMLGCAASRDLDQPAETRAALSLDQVRRELAPGDRGPDVQAVYAYLKTYGYFPNPALEQRYPYWAPLVEKEPADTSTYGPELKEAVWRYQGFGGLPQTGSVDLTTLELMKSPRCGHPENEFALRDPSDKWDLWTQEPLWTKTNLTWRITSVCTPVPPATTCTGLPNDMLNTAFANGFAAWQNETNLNFRQISSGTPDYDIKFYALQVLNAPSDTPDGFTAFINPVTAAQTMQRSSSDSVQRIGFRQDVSWSAALLQQAVIHELGHSLGLWHTGNQSSVVTSGGTRQVAPAMWWAQNSPNGAAGITIDDRQAIIAVPTSYTSWKQIPAVAVDIAVGGTEPTAPALWATSTNNTIYRYDGPITGWTQISGDGVAIAVTSMGVPWVVSSNGLVWRQVSGGWQQVGTSGRDIAIGGISSWEAVWIVSGISTGDGNFLIQHWSGSPTSAGFFQNDAANASGVHITVDSNGQPWVVRVDGSIWQLPSGTTTWLQLTPNTSCATDIGAGVFGGVYVTGCATNNGTDYDIWTLDSNTATTNIQGSPVWEDKGDSKYVFQWRPLNGIGRRIAVGPDGRPYVAQSTGALFRRDPR